MTNDGKKPRRLPTFQRVGRPSSVAYRELIGRLADSADRVDTGADPLAEATQCLRNVLSFLQSNPIVADAILPGPLTVLHNALHDWQQGGWPALLERGRPGRATNLANRDLARAYVASALGLLMRHGEPEPAAAAWVVQTCATLGIRHQGELVQAERLRRWRRNLASQQGAAMDAIAIYERCLQRDLRGLSAKDWALVTLRFVARNYNESKSRETPHFPDK